MDRNRISRFHTSAGRISQGVKHLQAGTAWLSGQTQQGIAKALPWIKDHAVSVAVLLALPVAIGAFFWQRPSQNLAHFPADYIQDPTDGPASQSGLPQIDEAPVSSVIPEGPIPSEPPQVLFNSPPGQGELGFPRSLPMTADAVNENSQPPLPWAISSYSPENSVSQCVWLTGSIEPVEGADLPQTASRVHELTTPPRH